MNSAHTLPLLAGQRPDGQLVYEEIQVSPGAEADTYTVLASPAFCKGFAKGDRIRRLSGGGCEVLERSGQLAITIIARQHIDRIAEQLGPHLGDIDASVDQRTDRMLVLSVPVKAGFELIEGLLTDALALIEDCTWFYGNVYDRDGAPLEWWQVS